jgi:hypothetical protein
MSIKTIDKPMQGSAGIAKKINKGAEKMVFDILQSTQYSMPIQSTIRELVTNACDSQREKEVAVEILSGKKKVEDYYIERHGAQYEDSNFDSSYYQLSSLQHGKNHVDLLYKQNEGLGYCDIFSVTDYGVGIGSRRLEGILELGYSTKRNTSENFGAFGLGAKAALSTGVDFYTIETIYNGMRFKCNCYNYKTDFIIPAFNVKTGMQNQFITFSDGTKVYYEYSNEVNQTTVSFGVKRHNRNKFEEAIEEQLMYFDNVNFKIIDEDEYPRDVNFKTEVLYNSKNIIVGDSYYFSKPHIVLVKDKEASTGINYGYIDFKELEMEQMYGCVAFKCPARQVVTNEDGTETVLQEGVDVTPSREKVIWNESTKNYIKSVIKSAAEEASEMVEKQLEETDFLKWIDKCRSIIAGDTDDRILSRIARIIDKNEIKPKFGPDPRIKYSHITKLFEGLKLMRPFRLANAIEREPVKDWHSFDAKHFYAREEQFSKYKDVYLRQLGQEHADKNKVCTYSLVDLDEFYREDILKAGTTDAQMLLLKDKARVSAKRTAILNFITKSEWYKNYDSVEVPEDFIVECKEIEAEDEEKSKFTNLSAVDRREIEKRMVAYTLRWDHLKEDNLTLEKIEPKAKDLMSSSTRIYYCTKEDEGKMRAAALLLKNVAPHFKEVYPEAGWSDNGNQREAPNYPIFWYEHPPVRFMKWDNKGQYYDWAVNPVQGWDTPQLIRVSQNKVKFITQNPNVKHIDELFLQLTDNNGYTMDNSLIKYYTAHKLEKINNFKFLQGLKCIHPTLQEDYCELMDLRNDNYSYYEYKRVAEIAPAIVEHMDKVFEFQKFITQCDDEDLIAQKSKELFVLSDISEAKAADLTILAKYDNIVEFAEEVKPLLDELMCLENRDCTMSSELEKEVRVYLRAKSRETWES